MVIERYGDVATIIRLQLLNGLVLIDLPYLSPYDFSP